MARSYKKVPGFSDQGRDDGFHKRQAAKKVRRAKFVQDGKWYRKLFNSYDICDWRSCYWTKKDLIRRCGRHHLLSWDLETEWRRARSK